jgi:hypothetical protein
MNEQEHLEETTTGTKEPYDWEKMTIHIGITIFPDDENPDGRLITLAAWSHKDPPLLESVRANKFGSTTISGLLEQLKGALPSRQELALERRRIEQESKTKEREQNKTTKKKSKPEKPTSETRSEKKKTAATKDPASAKLKPTPIPKEIKQQKSIDLNQPSLFGET